MTRALVTGSTGFTGRHLVRELVAQGIDVVRASARSGEPGVRRFDLASRRAWEAALAEVRPDLVFHLHGASDVHDPIAGVFHNVLPAAALLDAAAALRVPASILLVGSAAEYGPRGGAESPVSEDAALAPTTLLGSTKAAQTRLALDAAATRGLRVVVARPANLVGPGVPATTAPGAFAARLAAVAAGRATTVRTGRLDTARDLVDVRDAVRAYVALARCPGASGRVVHVSTGRATPMREVLARLIAHFGVRCPVEEEASLTPARSRDVATFAASPALLRSLVGEVPSTPLDATLADLARAVREAPARP